MVSKRDTSKASNLGYQQVAKRSLIEQLHEQKIPLHKRYREKAFGGDGIIPFLEFELATLLFGNLSGSLGYLLRGWSYRRLFKSADRGVIIGRGITLRHPRRIRLGQRVAIDDYVLLDAGGTGEEGMVIGDDVIISRNCVIQGKTGHVVIGDKTQIGCNTVVSSVTGILIGQSVLIAGNCYIGGGRYSFDRIDLPIMEQTTYSRGPVIIKDDVWLGAGSVIVDGIQVGKGCVVGAGAVVTEDLPDYAIAKGVPARVDGFRGDK